jgi:hypothetical protein
MSDELTTSICNGSIAILGSGMDGADSLESYETDTTTLANWCRRRFDPCRRRALLAWRWNEAIKLLAGTDAGGDDSGVVHPGYDYAYAIPVAAGCLALRGIVDEDGKALKHRPAGGFIHTDYATDEFYWDFILDLESGFSEGLRQCIEYLLAADLAGPIYKGDKGDAKRRALLQEYRELILPDAQGWNQAEQYDETNESAPDVISEIT